MTVTAPSSRAQRTVLAAVSELEQRGLPVTVEALTLRTRLDEDAVRRCLAAIGVAVQSPQAAAALATVLETSDARLQVQAVFDRLLQSLPPLQVLPAEPVPTASAAPSFARTVFEPVRHRVPEGSLVVCGVGAFILAIVASLPLGMELPTAYLCALGAGAGGAVAPQVVTGTRNLFSRLRASSRNQAEGRRIADIQAAWSRKCGEEAPRRAADAAARAAWEKEVADVRAAQLDTIPSTTVAPFSKALEQIGDPYVRNAVLGLFQQPLEALLSERDAQLTVGAKAELSVLRWQAEQANKEKVPPLVSLGLYLRHIDPGDARHRKYIVERLEELPGSQVAAVARRYQIEYFDAEQCKVPGDRGQQTATLVNLRAFQRR